MRNVFKHPDHQHHFETYGYVILDILTEEDVNKLTGLYTQIEDQLVQMPFATSNMSGDSSAKEAVSLALEQAFSNKIDELFDNHKWFFGSFIYKYPSPEGDSKGEVAMHQDASLTDEGQFHSINIFCALSKADETTGALQIIPGSHKLNQNPRGFGQPFPYTEHESLLKSKLKRVDLNPGQAVIYTTKLFHYSCPNRGNTPRIVAAGIVGPQESQLQYYHVNRFQATTIEVFNVDASYYLNAPFFSRPDESKYTKTKEEEVIFTPLTSNHIEHILSTE